jgi:hypothetical protein
MMPARSPLDFEIHLQNPTMASKQAPPAVALPRYALGEEIANATTHALGIALAMVGFVVLSVLAARSGTVSHVVASAIFGAALVLASRPRPCITRYSRSASVACSVRSITRQSSF